MEYTFSIAIRLVENLSIGWLPIQLVVNWSNAHSTSRKLVEYPFRIAMRPVENWLIAHSTRWKLVKWPFDWFKIGRLLIQPVAKLVECPFDWLKIGRMPIQPVENWSIAHLTSWKLVEYLLDCWKRCGTYLDELHITYFSNKNMEIGCKSTRNIFITACTC